MTGENTMTVKELKEVLATLNDKTVISVLSGEIGDTGNYKLTTDVTISKGTLTNQLFILPTKD